MSTIKQLVERLTSQAKDEVFWLGPCEKKQVRILEDKLNVILPDDLKEFLLLVGGGGVIGEELSGVVDNNALAESGGAIYYETCYCRKEFSLPMDLVVIYFKDDDVCWCINVGKNKFGQVANYDLASKKITNTLAYSFEEFLDEYVSLRT